MSVDPEQDLAKPASFVPVGQIPGETVLWRRDITRGTLRKRIIVQEWITNVRIFRYDIEGQRLLSQIALKSMPDVLVENTRRRSQSYGSGLYSEGVYTSSRSGTSHEIGDVLIMKDGVISTKLSSVVDPQGLKRLIDTVKREVTTPQGTSVGTSPPIRGVNLHSTVGTFCVKCGTQLPAGSNFCNKCGSVQG